jgi:hypothetical protein
MWITGSKRKKNKTYFSELLMGLPLRLTSKDRDITFQILDNKAFDCGGGIAVSFNGHTYQLYKPASQWLLKESSEPLDTCLASAIGQAISLRYRI